MTLRVRDIDADQIITVEELEGKERLFTQATLPPSGTEEIDLEFYERYSMTLEKLDRDDKINITVSDYRVAE